MKNKKLFKALFASLCCTFLVFSCSNLLEEQDTSIQYCSLTINDESSRAVFAKDITRAVVTVASSDMKTITVQTLVNDGSGDILIQNIPIGKNRVITVQGYSESAKISGLTIRTVKNIVAGSNSATVNWDTTAKGNVYNALLNAGVSIAKLSNSEMQKIDAVIPSAKAPLVNAELIASDYAASALGQSSDYILTYGSVKIIANEYNGENVQVGDPLSLSSKLSETAGGEITISNVAPGTWPLYVVQDNEVVWQKNINVTSDTVTAITIGERKITDRIILHSYSKNRNYLYAWQGDSNKLCGEWPGTKMEDEGSSWWGYTLMVTSSNIIFNDGSYYI